MVESALRTKKDSDAWDHVAAGTVKEGARGVQRASFDPDRCINKLLGSVDVKRRLAGGKRGDLKVDDLGELETIFTDHTQFDYPEKLERQEIRDISRIAIDIFKTESACVEINAPVTVAGDIHGQLFDLFELLCVTGRPPYTSLLFLGDYVDRGFYSIESVCLVLLFKIKFPNRVAMIRGNHETRQITQVYGFYDECLRKYGDVQVWSDLMECFDHLPLSATVDGYIFCDHGGLSPTLDTIDKIRDTDRFKDIPHDDPMADLLWSDPDNCSGWTTSARGAGFHWGEDITETFCTTNNLQFICRAHQLVPEGFALTHSSRVATVFSAPNYCYRCGNKASICEIYENRTDGPPLFVQFDSAPKRSTVRPLQRPPEDFF